jgi:hypothetical protein
MQDASIVVDYIYLDSEERRRFAQVGHEYLIEQVQFTGEESIQNSTFKSKLGFNHPTKFLTWCAQNGDFVSGRAFLAYSHLDRCIDSYGQVCSNGWDSALDVAAENLVLSMFNLETLASLPVNAGVPANTDNWILLADAFDDHIYGDSVINTIVVGGTTTITITNQHSQPVYGRIDVLVDGAFKLISRIVSFSVVVDEDGKVTISNIVHRLSLRDLSRSLSRWTDNRNQWVKDHKDAWVNQWHNCGLLLDGSHNPCDLALIQLNGHERFDRREGLYFNYVQPYQGFLNTPADGINTYSFALKPQDHQPSGTANLSRIDTTQLNIWLKDSTGSKATDGFTHDFINDESKIYIFAQSYNVLRIMSGMGGLAYSN